MGKKIKLGGAALGSLMILIGVYFFPLGQDIAILWLTSITGSQVNAWISMYIICFILLGIGFWLGGGRDLSSKIYGIIRGITRKPSLILIILLLGFIVFLFLSQYLV